MSFPQDPPPPDRPERQQPLFLFDWLDALDFAQEGQKKMPWLPTGFDFECLAPRTTPHSMPRPAGTLLDPLVVDGIRPAGENELVKSQPHQNVA
jgi:hypothetical protein